MSDRARNLTDNYYLDSYPENDPALHTDELESLFAEAGVLNEELEDIVDRTFEPGDQLYYQGELFEVGQVWDIDESGEGGEAELMQGDVVLPKVAGNNNVCNLAVKGSKLRVKHLPAMLLTSLEEGTGSVDEIVVYETLEIQRVYPT